MNGFKLYIVWFPDFYARSDYNIIGSVWKGGLLLYLYCLSTKSLWYMEHIVKHFFWIAKLILLVRYL